MLLHNVDTRLNTIPTMNLGELRTLYVGQGQNLMLPDYLIDRVDIFDLEAGAKFTKILPRFGEYNLHYCVRPERDVRTEIYKPFTKGFLAAKCCSNVIAFSGTEDTITFLGADYPYLVNELSNKNIEEALDKAEYDFGGSEWLRALDVMKEIEMKVSPNAIASSFRDLVTRVYG